MIIDDKVLTLLRELHKELPVLSYEEYVQIEEMITSPDQETCELGQSYLYFSNFFERPKCTDYLLSRCSHLFNDDGKTLSKLIPYLDDNDLDLEIFNKLKENDNIRKN